jgi:energy-coupling factor transporter ATP-binding protein EcfA2
LTSRRSSACAIEVARLSKVYGDLTAVEDVSFTVPYGAVAGLLGPNGAGKSMIPKAIVGLLRPSGGSVRLAARGARALVPAELLGFVLDPPGLVPGHRAQRHGAVFGVVAVASALVSGVLVLRSHGLTLVLDRESLLILAGVAAATVLAAPQGMLIGWIVPLGLALFAGWLALAATASVILARRRDLA